MKRVKTPLVLIIIAAAVGLIMFSGDGGVQVDSTDKFHKDLYDNAVGGWDATLTTHAFESQEINSTAVGSSSRVRVTWNQPEEEYNHFVLTISDPLSDWFRKESGEHDRISLDLDMLSPSMDYTIALQACLQPTCEEWLISTAEVIGTPSKMYWEFDGTIEGEILLLEPYITSDEDTLPEEMVRLSTTNSVLMWPDGSNVNNEDDLGFLDETYDQTLIYIGGDRYNQKVTFSTTDEEREVIDLFASATLMNP